MPVTTRSRSLRIHNNDDYHHQTRRMTRSSIPLYSSTSQFKTQKAVCKAPIVCEEHRVPRKIQTKRYNTRSSTKRFLELSIPEPSRMITRSMSQFLKNYNE